MLPRLEAEQDLRFFQAVSAGTGSMRAANARSWLADLRRRMGRRGATRPKTAAEWKAMGMRVSYETKE